MYSTLAYFNKAKGNYRAAITYFTKAYHYDELSGRFGISAEVLSQIGIIYSEKFGMYDVALQYFQRALPYANSFFSFLYLVRLPQFMPACIGSTLRILYSKGHLIESSRGLTKRNLLRTPDNMQTRT